MAQPTGVVYLLHFDRPYHHAKHYLGFTPGEVEDRVREHQCGRGARLVEVVVNAGISLELARTWSGSRRLERRLKDRHDAPRMCPLCTPRNRRANFVSAPTDADFVGRLRCSR